MATGYHAPTFSSSEEVFRIITIDIHSATLKSKEKGSFYVRILVNQGQSLETKLSPKENNNPIVSWNQKFVLSVPQDFIFDKKSAVSFTLFKFRKHRLSNLEMGTATSEMKSLFPVQNLFKNDNDDDNNKGSNGEAIYDTDRDDDESSIESSERDEEEQEEQPKATFELTAGVGIPVLKGSSVVGTLNVSIAAWEKYGLNLLGCSKKSETISNGSIKLGCLTAEMAGTEEKCGNFVGGVKWKNLAMEYNEFMMEKEIEKKPKKRTLRKMLCFVSNELKP